MLAWATVNSTNGTNLPAARRKNIFWCHVSLISLKNIMSRAYISLLFRSLWNLKYPNRFSHNSETRKDKSEFMIAYAYRAVKRMKSAKSQECLLATWWLTHIFAKYPCFRRRAYFDWKWKNCQWEKNVHYVQCRRLTENGWRTNKQHQ